MEENKKETEESTQTAEGTGNVDTQTANKTEGKAYKVFNTEEEYQNAVDKIIASKLPKKEEVEAFKKWQENNKTEEEKKIELENQIKSLNSVKQENLVLKKGVKADDVDYVLFKVLKMDGDFEENLESYLKENPKYLNSYIDNSKEVSTVDLGGEHKSTSVPDLSKMSYEEYKEYRSKDK